MISSLLACVVLVSSCTQAMANSTQQSHPSTECQDFQLPKRDVKTTETFECQGGIHRTDGLPVEAQERIHDMKYAMPHDWENNQRGRGANGAGNLVHRRPPKGSAIAVSSRSQILAMVAIMPLHLATIFVLPL